jgi:glutamine amidotransferase
MAGEGEVRPGVGEEDGVKATEGPTDSAGQNARPHIVVIDYHKGNLSSVERSLCDVGADAEISDDPDDMRAADALVLPGVGAFADAMAYLRESGQDQAILESIRAGRPFLGICLGVQLLFTRGNEGAPEGGWVDGLGVLEGSCIRLPEGALKVPHVGWDQIHLTEAGKDCPILSEDMDCRNFYFTHSYVVDGAHERNIAATTDYLVAFPSVVWSGNVFGCQFHPEKSSTTGAKILTRFVGLTASTM